MDIQSNFTHPPGVICVDFRDCCCESAASIRRTRSVKYDKQGNYVSRVSVCPGSAANHPVEGITDYSSNAFNIFTGANIRINLDVEVDPVTTEALRLQVEAGKIDINALHLLDPDFPSTGLAESTGDLDTTTMATTAARLPSSTASGMPVTAGPNRKVRQSGRKKGLAALAFPMKQKAPGEHGAGFVKKGSIKN